MPVHTDEWCFKSVEEVFSIIQPGAINLDQFAAEIAESQGPRNRLSNDAEPISQDPKNDFRAKLKLTAMINGLTESSNFRTADEVLNDPSADQELEITLMLRNSGIEPEQPTYRLNSAKTRRGVLNGNEPMPVAGLKDVYVDDDFFVIKDLPEKRAKDEAIVVEEASNADETSKANEPDIKSTEKIVSRSGQKKSKKPKLAAGFGDKSSKEPSTGTMDELSQSSGSSMKFYTPRELYEKRRFGMKHKVISLK